MEATFTHVVNPVMCMILPKTRVLSPLVRGSSCCEVRSQQHNAVWNWAVCSLLREAITMTAMLHDLEVSCWVWRVDCRRGWKYSTGRCLDELTKQHIGNMVGSHERYDIYYFVDMFYPVVFFFSLLLGPILSMQLSETIKLSRRTSKSAHFVD